MARRVPHYSRFATLADIRAAADEDLELSLHLVSGKPPGEDAT